jgi:hypothetical protein
MAAADTFTVENQLEAVLPVWSVPRIYDEGQLPLVLTLERALRRE